MAKPIPATPVVRGKIAHQIVHEIQHGTPMTPERKAMFDGAKRNHDRYAAAYTKKTGPAR